MGLNLSDHFEEGAKLYGEVISQEQAEAIRQQINELRSSGASEERIDQAEFGIDATWGFMFHRKGLALRDRALALISADVCTHAKGALADHVRLALYAGVTPAEIREIMFMMILYLGFPQTREANGVINPILQEYEAATKP